MHANAINVEATGSITFIGRMGGQGILRLQETFLTTNDLRRASRIGSNPSGRLATLHRDRGLRKRIHAVTHPPGFLMVAIQVPSSVSSSVPKGVRVQMMIRPHQDPGWPAWVANVDGEDAILKNGQDTLIIPVRYGIPQHGMRYEVALFPVNNRTTCRLININIPMGQESFEFSEPSEETIRDESRLNIQ